MVEIDLSLRASTIDGKDDCELDTNRGKYKTGIHVTAPSMSRHGRTQVSIMHRGLKLEGLQARR